VRADEARAELLRLLAGAPASAPGPAALAPGDSPPFPIDHAALLLAVDEYPDLDLAACGERLDGYASRVAERVGEPGGERAPLRCAAALRQVLYEEEGFHGNREEYYDVRNSYLNQVLDRKLGIPISLAALLLGVARRRGWPLQGVNFPGHFLVSWNGAGERLVVDPFDGLVLGKEELEERWRLGTGSQPPGVDRMLALAPPRAILIRMLNNVRLVHVSEGEFRRAAVATEKIALLDPDEPGHERELGALYLRAGERERGMEHLERYLARAPHAPDAGTLREGLERLRRGAEE